MCGRQVSVRGEGELSFALRVVNRSSWFRHLPFIDKHHVHRLQAKWYDFNIIQEKSHLGSTTFAMGSSALVIVAMLLPETVMVAHVLMWRIIVLFGICVVCQSGT